MQTYSIVDLLPIVFATLVVLFLPGWAWQAWFPHPGRDTLENLGEAAALSVSVTAVLALITHLAGIRWTGAMLVGAYTLLAFAALAGWLLHSARDLRGMLPTLVALTFFAGLAAWRLYQARDLALPAWVDSVHHTLIVRVFLERGGLTPDLLPYLAVPLSYHYAFHAMAAVFTFWSGLSLDQAVLIFGQIINAAVCLSIYRLGKAVWGDVKPALGAVLLVAFFSHMPAYYLTWGRYTLLTGLIVLLPAMAAGLDAARRGGGRFEWMRLALLTAGVLLAHYLAAVLLAIYYIILGVPRLWGDLRQKRIDWVAWRPLLLGAGIGLLLASPWLWRVWEFSRWGFRLDVVVGANEPNQVYFGDYLNYIGYLLGPARNHVLIVLGALGMLYALTRRGAGHFIAWALVIGLQTIPWGLRLGPFRPDHLAIIWFVPLSLFAGELLTAGLAAFESKAGKRWAWGVGLFLAFGFSYWGMKDTRSILNPATIFADAADTRAVEWVAANTPPQARFWVNTAPWQGSTYRGVDGGWWITPLTGRGTLVPPALYSLGITPYVQMITNWAQQASQVTTCDATFWSLVDQADLTHVYLHAGKGSLQPAGLQGCAGLREIYHDGDVWIYEIGRG